MSRSRSSPVYSYLDPRVEVYAPTESFPYYRIVGYANGNDADDWLHLETTELFSRLTGRAFSGHRG